MRLIAILKSRAPILHNVQDSPGFFACTKIFPPREQFSVPFLLVVA